MMVDDVDQNCLRARTSVLEHGVANALLILALGARAVRADRNAMNHS